MEKCLHVPLDFESRSQFRLMERLPFSPQTSPKLIAAALVLFLWRELAYAAQAGGPVGFLPADQADLLNQVFPGALDLLTQVGFLAAVDGGYFCGTFAADNQHFSPDHMSIQKQGGIARSVALKKRQFASEAQQHSLLLPPELFVKGDGSAMSADEVNRVMMVVKLLDNYLGRKSRVNSEYSPGLVQDAWTVLDKFSDEEINLVCRWIYSKRRTSACHPGLPKTTEQILCDFGRFNDAAKSSAEPAFAL